MVDQDMSPLEERQAREREQHAVEHLDHEDATSTLLPRKALPRPASSLSSVLRDSRKNIPRITMIQNDALKKLDSMSQSARYTRLLLFVVIELLWLGFALFSHFHVLKTSSAWSTISIPSGFISINRDTLLKSGLSTVAITIQLIALLPVTAIVVEVYSSEWEHILSHSSGRLTRTTDRVSTLTSSFPDRFAHMFSRHSHASMRFRLVFAAGIFLLLLQALAPGALIISSDVVRVNTIMTIGALDAGQTNYTEPVGYGVGESTVRARKIAAEAARYEYFAWIRNTTLDFEVTSGGLLFGMPPRELLSSNSHVEYQSDGVQFKYECTWLAPTYVNGSIVSSTWTFGDGGATVGTLDYNAVPASANPTVVYGIWPLMVTTSPGSDNGSFAWLFIGGGTGPLANTDLMPISLSYIPASQRTYNESGWKDLLLDNNTSYDPETSTDASVLFCDPHLRPVTTHVTLRGQEVSAYVIEEVPSVGNVDLGEASRMLGRSLNAMPWDTVEFETRGRNPGDGLSELAVNFSMVLTKVSLLPLVPLPLDVLAKSLGEYTTIAGASAYFDGSLGNVSVPAQRYDPIQRLICSWPQWSASVVLLLVVSILVGMTIGSSVNGTVAVPLSCASVLAAVDPDRAELLEDDTTGEERKSESFEEKAVQA